MQNDPFRKKRLVHFEAGIRILDLCEALDKQNLAMPTLGGSNGQSLAGAISTSTHGGDWNQPPFPDLVRAFISSRRAEGSCGSSQRATRSRKPTRTAWPCAPYSLQGHRNRTGRPHLRRRPRRLRPLRRHLLRRARGQAPVPSRPGRHDADRSERPAGAAGWASTGSLFTALFRLLARDPAPAGFSDAQGVPYFVDIIFNSQRPSESGSAPVGDCHGRLHRHRLHAHRTEIRGCQSSSPSSMRRCSRSPA